MPVRRIVIDSAHVRGASAASNLHANLANELREVGKVEIVDAIVTMPPVEGNVYLTVTHGVTKTTRVEVMAGYYDNSFAIFKDHVVDSMSKALYLEHGGDAVYDSALDQFVLYENDAPNNPTYSRLVVAVDNQTLADLLGWERTFAIDASPVGVKLRMPSFQSYHWPRAPPPVYIHIEQMRTEQQAATGIVAQTTGRDGETLLTPESLSGVASALTHVIPSLPGSDATVRRGGRVLDEQVFDMPISTIRRLDVRVVTADGAAYDAARVFIVMDAHCGRRTH